MAREHEKPDVSRLFCPNGDCPDYSQFGRGNLRPRRQYGKARRWMIECRSCGKEFSQRRGTVFFGLHASEEVIGRTLQCVAEGNGIRATARIQGVNKDTVGRWLARAGEHGRAVNNYLMTELQVDQVQLDELWSFVKKKGAASDGAGEAGGRLRGSLGVDGVCPGRQGVCGGRSGSADLAFRLEPRGFARLVTAVKAVVVGMPLFFSDQLRHYTTALLAAYGKRISVPRPPGKRGPKPSPKLAPPPELQYAQVVKR